MKQRFVVAFVLLSLCLTLLSPILPAGQVAQASDQSAPNTRRTAAILYDLNSNAIQNPGAESGTGSWNAYTATSRPYGYSNVPTLSDPGPANRGESLFYGGYSYGYDSTLKQQIELSSAIRQKVNAGQLRYDLSAWLGGYQDEEDRVGLTVDFLNMWSTPIQSVQLPAVTREQRNNVTGLFFRATSGKVPVNTYYVDITLTFKDLTRNQNGDYNHGFADNLSLVFRTSQVFLPMVMSPAPAPNAPSELYANPVSSTGIDLFWTDNSNNETGFEVERAPYNSGAFTRITTTAANVAQYQDRGLSPATSYTYRVRAVGASGKSAYTLERTATTHAAPPAAPSGLAASQTTTNSTRLNWTDNASNETGFEIEQSTAGGAFTKIAGASALPANTITYQVTGLQPNTAYTFRVRAINTGGASAYSNTAQVQTLTVQTPPAAPSGLAASQTTASSTQLTWTDNANNETGFELERSVAGGAFTQIAGPATLPTNTTSYAVSGLTANTSYAFRLRAVNASGQSAYSNTVQVQTLTVQTPPAAPSSLAASQTTTTTTQLTWSDNANNETGFELERSVAGGAFSQIAGPSVLPANTTSYAVSGLTANTSYAFRLRAVNASGQSAYSNTVQVQTLTVQTPPAAPSSLTASQTTSNSTRLTWSDNANNETGFELERSTAGGAFALIAGAGTLPTNTTTYQVSGLQPNTSYAFRVRAVNGSGQSAYSNTVQVQTQASTGTLRITNKSAYFIVSLKVNNYEQMPDWTYAIATDSYKDYSIAAGTYTVVATTGYWNTQVYPNQRIDKYIWTYSVTIGNGEFKNLEVPNPSIYDLMTGFQDRMFWKGTYWKNNLPYVAGFCFYKNGRYRLYDNGILVGIGTFSLKSFGNIETRFYVDDDPGYDPVVYEGLLATEYGYFYLWNGPVGWQQIQYYQQGSTITNQTCPVNAP